MTLRNDYDNDSASPFLSYLPEICCWELGISIFSDSRDMIRPISCFGWRSLLFWSWSKTFGLHFEVWWYNVVLLPVWRVKLNFRLSFNITLISGHFLWAAVVKTAFTTRITGALILRKHSTAWVNVGLKFRQFQNNSYVLPTRLTTSVESIYSLLFLVISKYLLFDVK